MSDKKIRYKAKIAGKNYTIIGARSQKHLQLVEQTVDEQLRQIEALTSGLDPERRAVLAAVNAVSDQIEMQINMQKMEKEIEELKQKLRESNMEHVD
ncbi:cell division protein ZapA [Pisciglobus halotolerans]|uniref:Cell division protein ZapA n=1 Tax=Pisciglobus halotolerans TaxID=745365 RepID=A0A1I3CJP8_9LACT|nr:cell division protein ZapA [Pisciglobus halotolerans]SFH74820.1 cell division protein ZapA [Pisciglobus halotolerans]